MEYTSDRYFAVIESGGCSCSMDLQLWEEYANCDHAHKTRKAAQKCLEKRMWCNGTIHNQRQERV